MTAKRIQLSRVKGFKLSEISQNYRVVSRPSKWGNPFKCMSGQIYVDASYRRRILDPWVWLASGNEKTMLAMFEQLFNANYVTDSPDLAYWNNHFLSLDLSELRGKDLACWCKDDNCHATILLKLANQ